jgi:hypothetical protein
MTIKLVQFLAILLAALCLVPAGAHLFELPGKIRLDAESYLQVQQIYRGWGWFGVPLFGTIVGAAVLAFLVRSQSTPLLLALAGGALIAVTLALFFIFVFPSNQATENWTALPANWEALRTQWECGHAVNAGLTLLAFMCVVASALAWRGCDADGTGLRRLYAHAGGHARRFARHRPVSRPDLRACRA